MKHNYIYTLCLALSLLFISNFIQAQGTTCATATPFCSSTVVTYPAGTNNPAPPTGPNYGCLSTRPNPAWFYFEVANPGTINMEIGNTPLRDIDFAVWGPFTPGTTPATACTQIFGGGLAPTSCSYSATINPERPSVTGTLAGQVFIMIITNYSNQPTTLTLAQTSGTGTTNCAILCDVDLGADVSTCGADGTSVTLTANVGSSTTGWTYKWFKDGVLIPGATAQTYVVPTPNVVANVTNTYRVEATNSVFTCTVQDEADVTIRSTTAAFSLDLGADISRCDAAGGITLNAANASHGATFTY